MESEHFATSLQAVIIARPMEGSIAMLLTSEEFRDLEERERGAVLAGDVDAIESFWSPELLVNGPHNQLLVGVDATLDMVRSGVIDFERFDRTVERVEIEGDIAVSMGSEVIMQKRGPQAGQLIHRRYTNVWRHKDGHWQLRFRHANVVPQQGQILDQPSRTAEAGRKLPPAARG